MQLTDIQIDRFGVWRRLAMPLRPGGINVVYGPNEAGKSTLLQFIRGNLFGFDSGAARPRWERSEFEDEPTVFGGSLRLTHDGHEFEVTRHADGDGRGTLSVERVADSLSNLADGSDLPSEFQNLAPQDKLTHILGETGEQTFRHVFAIGLSELQELSTLQNAEVARRIYGLSLGPDGGELVKMISDADQFRRRFFVSNRHRGELLRQLSRVKELDAAVNRIGDQRRQYAKLLAKQTEWQTQIESLKAKRAGLRQQLQGHEIVNRVATPWRQLRELERELASLPKTNSAPKFDWSVIEEIDLDFAELKPQYRDARRRENSARKKADSAKPKVIPNQTETVAVSSSPWTEEMFVLQGLVAQRPIIAEAARHAEQSQAEATKKKAEFDARLRTLGPDWSAERLDSIDSTHTAYHRLADAGRKFQSLAARKNRMQKKYKKTADACHKLQSEFDAAIGQIPESTLKEAIVEAKRQLADGEGLAQLQFRESEVDQRISNLQRELARLESRPDLPPWAPGFLLFLGIGGAILSTLGFITGLTTNGVAGLILALIGLAGFFIARGFQHHSEGHLHEDLAELRMRIRTHEAELKDIHEVIRHRLPDGRTDTAHPEGPQAQLIARASQRLSELKRLVTVQRRLKRDRKRLGRMRKSIQTVGREHDAARQAWCDGVRQVRLPETVNVDDALRTWQQVAEVREYKYAWDLSENAARDASRRMEQYRGRIETTGRQFKRHKEDYAHPLDVLSRWERELTQLQAKPQTIPAPVATTPPEIDDSERQKFLKTARKYRREAVRLKRRMVALKKRRRELLAEVGVSSREELESRQQHGGRRQELEELIAMAKLELEAAREEAPELAIVEDDLHSHDTHGNQESREELTRQLEQVEAELQKRSEDLGRVKQELATLTDDRTGTRLRRELANARLQLQQTVTQWIATETTADAVSGLRSNLERDGQTGTLELASEFLYEFTDGRYRRIWSPVDQQHLLIEDEAGQSFAVDALSNGTREQLFLSIRLALVEQFAEDGIELPLILDDVLVNFDHQRTAAVVETLHRFAERGHQVLLLTCHMHQAQYCESLGIEPIWLPGHHPLMETNRVA
ncbi:AAA family ATPase [Thalassoroseus pseudoceratinae]|uniref:AAA family ATPase n=1 Tax=Thalassoroseus pseudoceratinae TaxID=2713176 RepID=UPI001423EAC0|nr:AAA family ATPase [Thalassoroseus pseudoceratinae]